MNNTKPVVILDLDNCIANDAWRIPMIDWHKEGDARYHRYHAGAYYDENDTDWFYVALREFGVTETSGYRLFIFTARPERYRVLTELWLKDHLLQQPEAVFMRADNDHRSSPQMKADQLNHLLNPNNQYGVKAEDITFAADDRIDVLNAYMALRVKATLHHAIHDVCAYTPPKLSVPEILRSGADTYEQRNKTYGDNYKHYGALLMSMFPRGLTLNTPEDWNRLALIFACANKLSRYTWSFSAGGHVDSAHDLAVYAAMLQEMTP